MQLKQLFQLLMVALFLFTYQNMTVHSKQHFIEEASECHLCHAAEQVDLQHNESIPLVVNENNAVKIRIEVEKNIVNERFDYTAVSQPKYIKIIENRQYCMVSRFVGFNATAPPAYIS